MRPNPALKRDCAKARIRSILTLGEAATPLLPHDKQLGGFMRLLVFCCFAIFSQLSYAAEPIWLKDSTKGCLVLDPNPQPNETVTWSGNCIGGKADGGGEIVWYKDGIPTDNEKMAGDSGLAMVAGKYTFNVTPNDVRFELKDCDLTANFRGVRAFVKKGFALWHHDELAVPILNKAADFAQASCPTSRGFDNINVNVYYEGDQPQGFPDENYQIHARSSNGKWGELENKAWRAFYEPQKERYAALLAKRQADIQAARAAQERAQAENAHRLVRERYNAFAKKNSVSRFINTSALEANPFIYEGKTIAAIMQFSEMLTADRGLFNGMVVSGLPGNLFSVKNTKVVLAGKVLGKTPVKTPFGGEVSVPHLRFVDAHICAIYDCSDLVQ